MSELNSMPSFRLLNHASDQELLYVAHWFSGVLSMLPGTACGSQSVEAYHLAWSNHMAATMAGRRPMDAVRAFDNFVTDYVRTNDFFNNGRSLGQHPAPEDFRLLHMNGLLATCEVTAVDLFRFRGDNNYVIVNSTLDSGTAYVVFNAAPSLHHTLRRADVQTGGQVAKAKAKAKLRARLCLERVRRGTQLSAAEIGRIVERLWTEEHPASRAVDSTAAAAVVELMETQGVPLRRRLRELDILPRSQASPVDMKRLTEVLCDFHIVIAGNRANFPSAPSPSINALLCTCPRFSQRARCGHTVFVETIELPSVRASNGVNLAVRLLQLQP